jgi:dCTP deaminase
MPPRRTTSHILVDAELESLLGSALRPAPGATAPDPAQVQPASLDLRLGPVAYRVRAGFLPGAHATGDRLTELATSELSLEGEGAVLERGLVYLIRLDDELDLPPDLRARFNPRSSTGRTDLFTRVLVPDHPRFDETPEGYRGPLWLEVCPLSFPVRLRRGDRLGQVRLQRGDAGLTGDELREVYDKAPLIFLGERPLGADEVRFDGNGGLELSVSLAGRDPAGWRAIPHTDVVEFGREGAHDPRDFFEPVHAPGGRCILAPGHFYIFASREHLRIPPQLAAEMLPVDVGIGELRNNYAGFFDNGFGWEEDPSGVPTGHGTPAVLEVRAHDVPFLVEDGQVFCRLRFFHTSGRPERLYGQGRTEGSYRGQDLTLARTFRRG